MEAFPETEMLMCGCLVYGSTVFSLGHFIWILELPGAHLSVKLVPSQGPGIIISFQCLAVSLCRSSAAFASCGFEQEKFL